LELLSPAPGCQELEQSKAELSARVKVVVGSVPFSDNAIESAIEPWSCGPIFDVSGFRVIST
jgi:hypothetical protein